MLVRGEGRFTDDVSVARPGLRGDRAQPPCPRHHPRHRHRRGPQDEGRARRLYRRRPAAGYGTLKCIVPFKNRDGSEMKKPPRHALADRQGALSSATRSRSWSPRRCCRPRTPPKRSSSTSSRCRPSPIPRKRCSRARRALRRGARQRRARLSLRRQRQGRSRLRQGRACHAAQARQQPRRGQRDGAARRARAASRTAASRSTPARRACSA